MAYPSTTADPGMLYWRSLAVLASLGIDPRQPIEGQRIKHIPQHHAFALRQFVTRYKARKLISVYLMQDAVSIVSGFYRQHRGVFRNLTRPIKLARAKARRAKRRKAARR